MSKLNAPTKTNLRSKTGVLENAFRNSAQETNKSEEWLAKQKMVDDWNKYFVGKKGHDGKDLVKFFDNIALDGPHVIIQMYKENVIKDYAIFKDSEGNDNLQIFPAVSQIDGRKRNTDVPIWIDTPFPIIDKGVIMAVSPQVQLYYHELKEKLAKYDPIAAEKVLVPQRGDIVYTNHFLFKESRYYPDKNAKTKDFIKSQEDLRLNEFDFLFKVSNFEIESIIRPGVSGEVFDHNSEIVEELLTITKQLSKK